MVRCQVWYRKEFSFKLSRKSRTAHMHISKGGCFGTVLFYLLLQFGDSEG